MNYSDQVYQNVSLSLEKFLRDQTALVGLELMFLSEFDASRCHTKPMLLIQQLSPRSQQMGIDGGFWEEDVDETAKTVDTIYTEMIRLDFMLDLGTNDVSDRDTWSAVIKRIFDDAREAQIPVLDLSADPLSTSELGRLCYSVDDLAHNYLPEIPEDRTWRNVMRFTPEYQHRFVKVPNQAQLTGVELKAKEVAI